MRLGPIALLAVALVATAGGRAAPAAEAVTPLVAVIVPAEIPVDGTRTSLMVKVRLTNPATTPLHLQMSTPCDVHDWQLDTAGGDRVWERGPMICVQMITEQTVKAGETLEETRMLRIPAPLRAGETYKVSYEFWGFAANATFTAR